MRRREKVMIGISFAAFAGIAVLFASVIWYIWTESVTEEERVVGSLAAALGERTEAMIRDTRELLTGFDQLPYPRCSPEHLDALQAAAISRPHIRAIGYYRAVTRECGVGFFSSRGLRPPRRDTIYESGVVAWWPGPFTEIGGVQLFLMRFGDHDVAIDPRSLLDVGPLGNRRAGLWVEGRRFASQPVDAVLPPPETLGEGLTLDRAGNRAISRFTRRGEMPIDVIAIEPLENFLGRYATTLALGSGAGLLLLGGWVYLLMRYTRHRLSFATLLRQALASGRIHARYQPVVELKTRKVVGAEALARWTMEGGDAIAPDRFIPIAEREGLMQELTLQMLAAPLRDLKELLKSYPGLSVNINLSAEDLRDESFMRALEEGLATNGLSPKVIKLEITERALVNTDLARAMIRKLRERGHEVAVDDFGTGYSSLSYLSTFELDVLKIDKSFVDAIGTGAATAHVIVHVIEMAQSLGLRTVAEGVETEDQLRWLIEHGVEYGQGYLFSAPLVAEAFVDYVRSRRVP
jgi:sensor c-di-GMP phosphodiesterase-like protein